MGGVANAVKQAFSNPIRAGAAVMTFGTSELANKALGGKLFPGGGGYTPSTLPQSDPAMQLAQSGGAPLLTQVALGAKVDDALAGYFGRTSGADFQTWYSQQSPDQQAAIDGVRNQLNEIQSNTQLRDQAVQKVVNDFPNLVGNIAPQIQKAKEAAGEEFDTATKGYLDYALRSVAAKAGGANTISSGATIQASADEAAKMGLNRLDYTTNAGDKEYNNLLGAWQQQYTEANALRGFQQKMLGQGALNGFSAAQSALQRAQQTSEFNANAINTKGQSDQASSKAMLGMVGQLGGMVGGAALMGPAGAAVGSQIGKSIAPTSALADTSSNGYRSA